MRSLPGIVANMQADRESRRLVAMVTADVEASGPGVVVRVEASDGHVLSLQMTADEAEWLADAIRVERRLCRENVYPGPTMVGVGAINALGRSVDGVSDGVLACGVVDVQVGAVPDRSGGCDSHRSMGHAGGDCLRRMESPYGFGGAS